MLAWMPPSDWLAYVTRQLEAEDAVGVDKGLEFRPGWHAVVMHQAVQQCDGLRSVEITEGGPDCLEQVGRNRLGR